MSGLTLNGIAGALGNERRRAVVQELSARLTPEQAMAYVAELFGEDGALLTEYGEGAEARYHFIGSHTSLPRQVTGPDIRRIRDSIVLRDRRTAEANTGGVKATFMPSVVDLTSSEAPRAKVIRLFDELRAWLDWCFSRGRAFCEQSIAASQFLPVIGMEAAHTAGVTSIENLLLGAVADRRGLIEVSAAYEAAGIALSPEVMSQLEDVQAEVLKGKQEAERLAALARDQEEAARALESPELPLPFAPAGGD